MKIFFAPFWVQNLPLWHGKYSTIILKNFNLEMLSCNFLLQVCKGMVLFSLCVYSLVVQCFWQREKSFALSEIKTNMLKDITVSIILGYNFRKGRNSSHCLQRNSLQRIWCKECKEIMCKLRLRFSRKNHKFDFFRTKFHILGENYHIKKH